MWHVSWLLLVLANDMGDTDNGAINITPKYLIKLAIQSNKFIIGKKYEKYSFAFQVYAPKVLHL